MTLDDVFLKIILAYEFYNSRRDGMIWSTVNSQNDRNVWIV